MRMNAFLALLIFGAVIMLAAPFAIIWSINTLFRADINFSFSSWLAAHIFLIPIYYHFTYRKN